MKKWMNSSTDNGVNHERSKGKCPLDLMEVRCQGEKKGQGHLKLIIHRLSDRQLSSRALIRVITWQNRLIMRSSHLKK